MTAPTSEAVTAILAATPLVAMAPSDVAFGPTAAPPPVLPATAASPAGAFSALVRRVIDGRDLSEADMTEAVEALMGGDVSAVQAACFLTALRMKGETVDEIVGAARAMRRRATVVSGPDPVTLVDTCGTGGDGAETFNISTTAAFVLAGAGVSVAKHGNRAVSSSCGSADVLEALGVRLDLSAKAVGRCVTDVGIGFLFAPALHAAMRHLAPVRRELGIRTIFNLLGPLTNPAGAERQVVGVYRADMAPILACALGRLGSRRAMVVHGYDGLDEITITGPTKVAEWDGEAVREYRIHPEQVGLRPAPLESLRGGDVCENARLLRSVLLGEPGPRRDVVLLNAAAALTVAGVTNDLTSGVAMAARSIDSGMALAKLEALVETTQTVAEVADDIPAGTGGRAAAMGVIV
ncbi:MAG: anthranilate phosphoribosyltransferase [Thermoleophilia bacterium]